MANRVLFILKKRGNSYGHGHGHGHGHHYNQSLKSSGLINSARFVHELLLTNHIDSSLVEVVDNNDIDREVTKHQPTHVILEAMWVVPSKFDVLRKLHPNVKWIIRVHSEVPFLSGEGVAIKWALELLGQKNIFLSFNSKRTNTEFQNLLKVMSPFTDKQIKDTIIYLPNYYPVSINSEPYQLNKKKTIDVGCFGAIRPLKNHLIQAIAAIEFARKHKLKLNFHINATRVEGGGDNALKNLRALFSEIPNTAKLIEHPWLEYDQFVELVKTMDIGLQVSFSESFNIVTADFVNNGIPVVTSSEIEFVSPSFYASCTDSEEIVTRMEDALWYKRWVQKFYDINRIKLAGMSRDARDIWVTYFSKTSSAPVSTPAPTHGHGNSGNAGNGKGNGKK